VLCSLQIPFLLPLRLLRGSQNQLVLFEDLMHQLLNALYTFAIMRCYNNFGCGKTSGRKGFHKLRSKCWLIGLKFDHKHKITENR
jgi:hypothetical protein